MTVCLRVSEVVLQSVHSSRLLSFTGQVHQLRDDVRHPSSHLVTGDGRFQIVRIVSLVSGAAVKSAQHCQFVLLKLNGSFQRFNVGHGHVACGEQRCLKCGRQITAVEIVESSRRRQAAVEHNEAGPIVAESSQTLRDLCPHAGASLKGMPGMQEIIGKRVLRELCRH